MTNIGQDVTIPITVKVDGNLTDPGSISVHVTAPDGTEDDVTPTRLSLGTYEAVVAGTQADRWFYTVITTDPASVEHSHFDVSADPPPPAKLMPLATVGDLENRLALTGQTMTDAQRAAAPTLLVDASARIRGYTKQQFDLALNDTVILRPVGVHLRLPQRPVVAVDQVEMVGTAGTANRVLSVGEWAFDGIDLIQLWPNPYTPSGVHATGTYANTYRVTYDHGNATTPDFIVAKTCDVVLRVLTSPTFVAGLVSERIGQYSYQYGQQGGGQSPGVTVTLTKDDKQDLVDAGYRRRAGTVQLRAG